MENRAKTTDQIIADFRGNDQDVISRYYLEWRGTFIYTMCRQFPCVEVFEMEGIYSDSFADAYEKIRQNKFVQKDATIFTYIRSIGYNKLCTMIKKESRYKRFSEQFNQIPDWDIAQNNHDSEVQEITNKLIHRIGEPCKTILIKYYIEEVQIVQLADMMGYTEGGMKNRKALCLKNAAQELEDKLGITKDNWK